MEPTVYYGRRHMPRATRDMYLAYKAAARELSEYQARGEAHPLLMPIPEELEGPSTPLNLTAQAPRPVWLDDCLAAGVVFSLTALFVTVWPWFS